MSRNPRRPPRSGFEWTFNTQTGLYDETPLYNPGLPPPPTGTGSNLNPQGPSFNQQGPSNDPNWGSQQQQAYLQQQYQQYLAQQQYLQQQQQQQSQQQSGNNPPQPPQPPSTPPPTYTTPMGVADSNYPRQSVIKYLPGASGPQHSLLYASGILDNAAQYAFHLKVSPLSRGFILRNVDIVPFEDNPKDAAGKSLDKFTNPLCFAMAFLLSCARASTENKLDLISRIIACCGEALAPALPSALFLPHAEARSELVKLVDKLCRMPQVSVLTVVDANSWTAVLADAAGTVPAGKYNAYKTILCPNWPWSTHPAAGYTSSTSINLTAFTPELAMNILEWLSTQSHPSVDIMPLTIIVATEVAMAKRGSCTDGYLMKITNGIMTDLNKAVSLTSDVVKAIYGAYGSYMNAENAKVIFSAWESLIPPMAMRLRLTLQQAQGEGLTAINVIVKAVRIYPDFDWARVNHIFKEEVEAVKEALITINNNQYFGFSSDLKTVRSTRYKNVAYIAKELLIKVKGESALSQYGGWIRAPQHKAIIDSMILNYIDHVNQTQFVGVTDADRVSAGHWQDIVAECGNLGI